MSINRYTSLCAYTKVSNNLCLVAKKSMVAVALLPYGFLPKGLKL